MGTLPKPPKRSESWERGLTRDCFIRSAADSDRDSARNGCSITNANENLSPPVMPKALQGMLKATTETGNIGLFSIKPSRVPLPVKSPQRISGPYKDDGTQKPRQFRPYGVPSVDDRRCLPSYVRDASSEVISMYETASQKSISRAFNDPDCRSYSMTQAYPSYSLTGHRSYASLRSQLDTGGLLQRPKSPFAYPTRLKRPGTRPSSPAQTDGSGIDYNRRAEIDRLPFGGNHHTSSPASLYAQKRKPPLSLRPEANRSAPSLLSQPSPQRRSSSPYSKQRNGTPIDNCQRINRPASIYTSPARSTFSLASTVSLFQAAPAPSTTITPGNVPPSPLYYDYTEDFDVDDSNQPVLLDPPPQFRIEKTIPEDRPLSSNLASSDELDLRGQKSDPSNGLRNSPSAKSALHKTLESSQDSITSSFNTSIFGLGQGNFNQGAAKLGFNASETVAVYSRDTKPIRLSGLGLGARELSSHVEEAFGLPPSPSIEVPMSKNCVDQRQPGNKNGIKEENRIQRQSVRTSSCSLNTHLWQFPPPPKNLDGQYSDNSDQIVTLESSELHNMSTELSLGRQNYRRESMSQAGDIALATPSSEQKLAGDVIIPFSARLSLHSDQKILSQPHPDHSGHSGLHELTKTFEDADMATGSGEKRSIEDASEILPGIHSSQSSRLPFSNPSSSQCLDPQSTSFSQANGEIGHKGLSDQGMKKGHQRHNARRLQIMTIPIESENFVPNFSHHFIRKISRSESPMLAPKPISPARQLKLKNSVPQLMKALPPLPSDPSMAAVSPTIHYAFSEIELPCRFSPLIPESQPCPPNEVSQPAESHETEDIFFVAATEKVQEPEKLDLELVKSIEVEQVEEGQKISTPPPPKLKLKMRSSSTLRTKSPPESRPWNAEESYPWSAQAFNIGLPSVIQEGEADQAANPKPPKFKLKITRASTSTVGTVRINRESAESKPLVGLHLQHTKDLFTPIATIDTIFRQVSRHLYSRRASTCSNHHSENYTPEPILISTSDHLSARRSLGSNLGISQESSPPLIAASPTEVRSFFSDDSSYIRRDGRGGRGIRKRLSDITSRIVVPYGAANGTQSHDDITWRDRNGQEAPTPPFSRSIPNIQEGRANLEARNPRRLAEKIHAQNLRMKFFTWFKGARSAIRERVKSRKVTGRSDDGQIYLTGVV